MKFDDELPLDDLSCRKLLFSFAKLRVINTKHLTYQVSNYIKNNVETYTNCPINTFFAIVYLPELEGGQGIYCS